MRIPATVAINNNTRQVTDTVPLLNNGITKCPLAKHLNLDVVKETMLPLGLETN
jgi:hypothetical protein